MLLSRDLRARENPNWLENKFVFSLDYLLFVGVVDLSPRALRWGPCPAPSASSTSQIQYFGVSNTFLLAPICTCTILPPGGMITNTTTLRTPSTSFPPHHAPSGLCRLQKMCAKYITHCYSLELHSFYFNTRHSPPKSISV